MKTKKVHPSVEKFKEFVKENPPIIQEVRAGKATWQELFEDWYLLGEEDTRWDPLRNGNKEKTKKEEGKEADNKGDWMSQVMGVVKKMDPNQVQGHLNNLSQAIGAIQGLISQFQGGSQTLESRKPDGPSHPFIFRKD